MLSKGSVREKHCCNRKKDFRVGTNKHGTHYLESVPMQRCQLLEIKCW